MIARRAARNGGRGSQRGKKSEQLVEECGTIWLRLLKPQGLFRIRDGTAAAAVAAARRSCYRSLDFWCGFWLLPRRVDNSLELTRGIHKSPSSSSWSSSRRSMCPSWRWSGSRSHCHCMRRPRRDTLFIYSNNNNAMQTLIVIDCWQRRLRTRNNHSGVGNILCTKLGGEGGGWRSWNLCPFRVFLIGDRFFSVRSSGQFMSCLPLFLLLTCPAPQPPPPLPRPLRADAVACSAPSSFIIYATAHPFGLGFFA